MNSQTNNPNSIRLIAALALASHAPKAKQTVPAEPPISTNSSDTDSHRNSVDLDTLLNDPCFQEAVQHIRQSVHSTSGLDALSDPRVQRAIQQACEAMRNPEMKEALNRQNLRSLGNKNMSDYELPLRSSHSLARYASFSHSSPALIPSQDKPPQSP
ncbi:hypothetical protein DSO57_1019732 [Entomophthora muscae]|uniref:Uncharacterized protein n=1 Tax=Entomophthora muscae TaxID=34485 RepID=A0ACC2U1N6_9FUNG|nr:hypothetical protein DSO57_1019732 [Entomophthora muscae]